MARIPLPTRASLTDEALQQRWDRLAQRGPVLNVLRLFMVNPAIELNAFQVWRASGLDPRAREIVILRCAYTQQSTYEWHQHVCIAAGVGLYRRRDQRHRPLAGRHGLLGAGAGAA